MSHRTTLSDLVAAIAKNMTVAELAKATVNIQIQQMIHDTRLKKGWTQKELAERIGVKQSLVSRWESGDCNYTIDTLIDIADALGLSIQCPLKYEDVAISTEPINGYTAPDHNTVLKETQFKGAIQFDFRSKERKEDVA